MPKEFKEVELQELAELLEHVQEAGFGIGIHSAGLEEENLSEREKIANSILEKGLELGHGYRSILGNIQSLGRNIEISNPSILKSIIEEIKRKTGIEHNGKECKVIVAVPIILEEEANNPETQKLVLGFPARSIHSGSKAYDTTCFTDLICEKNGRIPNQFILGYITDGKEKITINPEFYCFLDKNKQKSFFSEITKVLGSYKEQSDKLLKSGEKGIEEVIEILKKMKFENPEKLVNSILIECKVRYNKKDITEEGMEQNAADDKENLNKKIGTLYDAMYKRGMIFRQFDINYAMNHRYEIEDVYKSFRLSDIQSVDDDNISICKRIIDSMGKLPKEMKIEEVLKENLEKAIKDYENSNVRRNILTDDTLKKKEDIQKQFETCVGAYILTGGRDIYSQFQKTIQLMNSKGIKANTGLAVIHLADQIADKMMHLDKNFKRNSPTWNALLEPVFEAYMMSVGLGNEKHNPEEHKELEDKLIALGIIEKKKDTHQIVATKTKVRDRVSNLLHRKDDNDKTNLINGVLLEHALLRQAINEYLNTGMVPIGYRQDKETGIIKKETETEKIKREERIKANELEQRKRMEKQRMRQELKIMKKILPQIPSKQEQKVRNVQNVKQQEKIDNQR